MFRKLWIVLWTKVNLVYNIKIVPFIWKYGKHSKSTFFLILKAVNILLERQGQTSCNQETCNTLWLEMHSFLHLLIPRNWYFFSKWTLEFPLYCVPISIGNNQPKLIRSGPAAQACFVHYGPFDVFGTIEEHDYGIYWEEIEVVFSQLCLKQLVNCLK